MSRVPCAAGMVQLRILFGRAKLVSPVTRGFDPGLARSCSRCLGIGVESFDVGTRGSRSATTRMKLGKGSRAVPYLVALQANVSRLGQPPSNRKRAHCSGRQSIDGTGRQVKYSRCDWSRRGSSSADVDSCARGAQLSRPLFGPNSAADCASRTPEALHAERARKGSSVRPAVGLERHNRTRWGKAKGAKEGGVDASCGQAMRS